MITVTATSTVFVLLVLQAPIPSAHDQPAEEEITALVESLASTIESNYVLEEQAPSIAKSLRAQEIPAEARSSRLALTSWLNDTLHDASGDRHFRIFYPDPKLLPPLPRAGASCWAQSALIEGQVARVFGFEKLPRAEQMECGLESLSRAKAIILDLRDCTGGSRAAVQRLVSQFLPAGVHYVTHHPRHERARASKTLKKIEGRVVDAPMVVLTSASTASGCEAVAYHLQALKRAIVVGETTIGAAHAVKTFDLARKYRMLLPVIRPVSSVTGSNWEGTGVVPDIETASDSTLERAAEVLDAH